MALQSSIIKIEGTIDDFTFYKSKDGYRVRRKTGVSAERIEKDPAFKRTRENGKEFGHLTKTGAVLRKAVLDLSKHISDATLIPRVVKSLAAIKNLDTTSNRGDRTVAVGLATSEGKELLKGFDFNSVAPLQAVVRTEIELDTATGTITLDNFDAEHQLAYPEGATHVRFRAGFLNLDFATGEAALEVSDEVETPLVEGATTVTMAPAGVPTGSGNQLYLLLVAFYQELNGKQYALSNGAYNSLSIIEVL